ncbi:MAG: hypothetical protein RBU30_24595 [Polyangia bacterium]|nr:hypothetical protein [Polyangia bacterium]
MEPENHAQFSSRAFKALAAGELKVLFPRWSALLTGRDTAKALGSLYRSGRLKFKQSSSGQTVVLEQVESGVRFGWQIEFERAGSGWILKNIRAPSFPKMHMRQMKLSALEHLLARKLVIAVLRGFAQKQLSTIRRHLADYVQLGHVNSLDQGVYPDRWTANR